HRLGLFDLSGLLHNLLLVLVKDHFLDLDKLLLRFVQFPFRNDFSSLWLFSESFIWSSSRLALDRCLGSHRLGLFDLSGLLHNLLLVLVKDHFLDFDKLLLQFVQFLFRNDFSSLWLFDESFIWSSSRLALDWRLGRHRLVSHNLGLFDLSGLLHNFLLVL